MSYGDLFTVELLHITAITRFIESGTRLVLLTLILLDFFLHGRYSRI